MAVDTLGHLLALCVTAANAHDRTHVKQLAAKVWMVTGEAVELAYVDQGYTSERSAADPAAQGIQLEITKLPEAKRGFVLLPRRWVVAAVPCRHSFGGLARDYERLLETLAGAYFVAFVMLLLPRFICLMVRL